MRQMQKSGYRLNRWLLLLSGLLVLAGCLSEISLEVPETDSAALAIRGKLVYGDSSQVLVKITRVSDFVASDIPEPVLGATVELINENEERLRLPMREAGIYGCGIPQDDPYFTLQPGRPYRLSVLSPDGEQYLSGAELLNEVPTPTGIRIDTIRREVLNDLGTLEDQTFLQFLITTPLTVPGDSRRGLLKWDFTGTYRFTESNVADPYPNTRTCYFTDVLDLENVVVFNGRESEMEILTEFLLLEEPLDYRFTDGFYLTAVQESLSEGAFRYWESTSRVINLTGNFFEAPPGKIKGNFYNPDDPEEEVFGYFYATRQDTFRLFVPPGERPVRPFCPLEASPGDENVSPVCFECNDRRGSTLVKPDFWME